MIKTENNEECLIQRSSKKSGILSSRSIVNQTPECKNEGGGQGVSKKIGQSKIIIKVFEHFDKFF